MPEGPEVKIIATQLNKFIGKDTLVRVKIIKKGYNSRTSGLHMFSKNLPMKIKKVSSKGKFIWFSFYGKNLYIANRLGMTGTWSKTPTPYSYFKFDFSNRNNKKSIYFNNPRKLGRLDFVTKEQLMKKINSLAPDILTNKISLDEFTERLDKYPNSSIYPLLLKQDKVLSGVGNYIVNEALYDAGISPHRKVSDIDLAEKRKLYKSLVKITEKSYSLMGCSQRDYRDLDQTCGEYQTIFKVYQRKKDLKGNKVLSENIQGRTAWFVPSLQK